MIYYLIHQQIFTAAKGCPRMSDHPSPVADGLAVSASLLCLVHCLALPLVVSALPMLGLLANESVPVHALLLAIALPLGLWALGRGRRQAGRVPLAIGMAGFTLMAAALALPESSERLLTVAGVLMVAVAHWRNWRAASQPQTVS
jgi:hypothetical protein